MVHCYLAAGRLLHLCQMEEPKERPSRVIYSVLYRKNYYYLDKIYDNDPSIIENCIYVTIVIAMINIPMYLMVF